MSARDGLRPVVVTSFFPTAREVSGGIKWLKDHPIVATAAAVAATAVSVMTYLRQDKKIQHVVSWSDEHGGSLTEIFGSDTDTERDDDVSVENKDLQEEPPLNNTGMEEEELIHSGSLDSTSVSPEWGWYVSITPPHDEQYVRCPSTSKNSMD